MYTGILWAQIVSYYFAQKLKFEIILIDCAYAKNH